MLSVFPALLDYSLVGVFILRVTVGFFFILFGTRLTSVAWSIKDAGGVIRSIGMTYGLAKFAVGTLLTLGLFTQVAAILGIVLSTLTILQDSPLSVNRSDKQLQILLFILCIALLFLGPGLFSIDIPL